MRFYCIAKVVALLIAHNVWVIANPTFFPGNIHYRSIPSKKVFFNFTKEINRKLDDDGFDFIQFVKNITNQPNIFYSTDIFMKDLLSLSPVATLLDENELKSSELLISCKQKLESRYNSERIYNPIKIEKIADIFYFIPEFKPEDDVKLKPLQKHISSVVIELDKSYCAATYISYLKQPWYKKWNLPILNYSKAILNKFELDPQIGILAFPTATECLPFDGLNDSSNFLINNNELTFQVFSNQFRLTYERFESRIESALFRQDKNIAITIALDISVYESIQFPDTHAQLYTNILDTSKTIYFSLLQNYIEEWMRRCDLDRLIIRNEVIIQAIDKEIALLGIHNLAEIIVGQGAWIIPQLNIQEVDTTACELQAQLGNIAENYENLVINQFTWFALVHFETEIKKNYSCDGMHEGDEARNKFWTLKAPQIYFYFTPGISNIWKNAETYFEKLLEEHKSVLNWEIQAVVFTNNDILSQDNQNIARFAEKMSKQYSIGCSVNLYFSADFYYANINQKDNLIQACSPIWNVTSVVILQIDYVEDYSRSYYRSNTNQNFYWRLMKLLIFREMFLKDVESKEVIMQVNYNGNCLGSDYTENYCSLFSLFAAIHKVKIIVNNA